MKLTDYIEKEAEAMEAEIKRLKELIADLDRLNRLARKYGQGSWSLTDIYQPRIDDALGILPFTEDDPEPVTEEEMHGQGA